MVNVEKMIPPAPVTVECDAACEFDKIHGKPKPSWMAETMIVHNDLGDSWWIVEETETKTCHLMYSKRDYMSDTIIPSENCNIVGKK